MHVVVGSGKYYRRLRIHDMDTCPCVVLYASFSVLLFFGDRTSVEDSNTWFTAYLPISSYLSFDNTGNQYNATLIFTNGAFDLEKYKAYSPVYLSVTAVLAFAGSFASITAVIVHTIRAYIFPLYPIDPTLSD